MEGVPIFLKKVVIYEIFLLPLRLNREQGVGSMSQGCDGVGFNDFIVPEGGEHELNN
jgi:hypothetical protein